MVYLIWQVHPKIYNIGKILKFVLKTISTYFYFLSNDHQLTYLNMLVPFDYYYNYKNYS
jgi:hypothetical protein